MEPRTDPLAVFGERFTARIRPGWLGGSHHGDTFDTAAAAVAEVAPEWVGTAPLTAAVPPHGAIPWTIEVPIAKQAILAKPRGDDGYALWGTVTDDYRLITPSEVAEIWDEVVGRPVSRAHVTGDGKLVFSTPLREFDVLGDQVESHLFIANPMDGLHAARAFLSPLRIWCLNQILAALGQATQSFRVIHDQTAPERFRSWLNQAVGKIEASQDSIQAAFTQLARIRISGEILTDVIETAYPLPKRPRATAPGPVMAKRLQRWEYLSQRTLAYRDAARALFLGEGTGMEHPAMAGTAWGLLNAITETEDWRQARGEGSDKIDQNEVMEQVGEAILFGERAQVKERAFDAVIALAA